MPERKADAEFQIPAEFNLDNFSDEALANMARSNLWEIIDNLPKKDREPKDVYGKAQGNLTFLRSVFRANESLRVLLRRREDITLQICEVESTRFSISSLPPFRNETSYIAVDRGGIEVFSGRWDQTKGPLKLTNGVLVSLWQDNEKLVKKFAKMEKVDILKAMVRQIPDFAG